MYILIMVLIKNDIDWNGWGANNFSAAAVVVIEYIMLAENSNEKITITKRERERNCGIINASEHFSTATQ